MPRRDASEPAGPHPSSGTPDGDNRAVPASTRTIGIGVVFLLVAGTLAVGLAFKLPCAVDDWTDGRAFTARVLHGPGRPDPERAVDR
jgi:hypothetical protein